MRYIALLLLYLSFHSSALIADEDEYVDTPLEQEDCSSENECLEKDQINENSDFYATQGLKLPKKLGGTLGQVIGQITNPIRDNVTAPMVSALNEGIDAIAQPIADKVTPQLVDRARDEGWTKESCTTVGAGAIILPAAIYIAPACAASAFITAGLGTTACVTSSSAAVIGMVCISLCQSHNLSGC